METSGSKARPCPRCGALNGAGFDRCIRCAAPLGALATGADALKIGIHGSVDPERLLGTKVLIGLTALVFFGQVVSMNRSGDASLIGALLRSPPAAQLMRFGAMLISVEHVRAEPYRLLSAVFVHIGGLHFLMNMLVLARRSQVVERGVGSARFVLAYLVCGVVGFATNIAVEAVFPEGPVPTAGASGAVFGVMGMTLGWLIRMRDRRWRSVALELAFYAAIVNLFPVRVNNGAHVGGLLCGVAFGFYFAWRQRPRSLLPANVGAVVGLVLAVVSLVLAQRAAGWSRRPPPVSACPSVPAAGPLVGQAPSPPPGDAPSCGRPLPSPSPGTIDSSGEVHV